MLVGENYPQLFKLQVSEETEINPEDDQSKLELINLAIEFLYEKLFKDENFDEISAPVLLVAGVDALSIDELSALNMDKVGFKDEFKRELRYKPWKQFG